jgi:hypothetical protein
MAEFSWYARQRRNQARMRQVTALMIDHYQRYPLVVRWVPISQRVSRAYSLKNQTGATS